ncbi:Alkane 1-monooxygenase [Psychrobacter okhotskensis]|uniref:alkane 1-monooxygenase n=1 Tax=Psychrobacter okhotskensis TaxID=212403 RepID=UPI003F54B42D
MTKTLSIKEHAIIQDAVDGSLWRDPERRFWLCSPSLPLLGCLFALGLRDQKGFELKNTALAWAGTILIHGIIPLADVLVGRDDSNPPDSAMQALAQDPYYKWIAHAFIPLQYMAFGLLAYQYSQRKLPWYNRLGVALTAGIGSGIAINTAHELGHKSDHLNRTLARVSLAPAAYGHFAIEHNFGHHRWVATPKDPASSKYNESFWQFLPRTVFGGLRSAVNIETERLARRQKGFWSKDNELLQGWAMSAVLYATLYKAFGKKILPFIGLQAVYGFSLLEVVNYLEHYGLLREQDDNGQFERTQPEHSWNSNHTVTNLFLYQLQRHSDHHAHPSRAYQLLRHFEEAPQLPIGYATMIMPAYIPPLWFAIMNNRVRAHYGNDMSKINMHPKPLSPLMQRTTNIIEKGLHLLNRLISKRASR